MILLEEEGVLRVHYEEENRLQIHEWLDYNPDGRDALVLGLLDRIHQLAIAYPVESVMVKADRARGAFSPEVQAFVGEVQFPRLLADTPIHFVVTVQAPNPDLMARIGTELWQEQLRNHAPLVLHEVDSEAAARDWLALVNQMAELEA